MAVPNPLRAIARNTPKPLGGVFDLGANLIDDFADLRHGLPGNDLDDWDPDYIERTLPLMRGTFGNYFRGEVRGLENIPADGPVLLVGNHSGGTLISDTFVFSAAFYEHFGPAREFHQLAHDMVFRVPGARALVSRWGTVPASPENMERALARGAALLVYPGGDHETYRPSWESSNIDFAERKGFARLALEHNVPVVPVVAIGGQETALFLGRGRRLARALRIDKTLRIKVLPPVLGPPFGPTVLDLPRPAAGEDHRERWTTDQPA
jgi:1-acyl-sn-glycerol-3-phosphate acyltransferase